MSVSFSPNGKLLASGSNDKTVRIWNPKTGNELKRLEGHYDSVYSVSFSPDSQYLASGSKDKIIYIWDIETGKELRRLKGHSDEIWSVSFSPDGKHLASVSSDSFLVIWDMTDIIQQFPHDKPEKPLKQWLSLQAATLARTEIITDSKAQKYCVTQNDVVSPNYWVPGKFPERDVKGCLGVLRPEMPDKSAGGVALSPDGRYLYCGHANGYVSAWDLETGVLLWKNKGHDSVIQDVALSSDGQLFASGAIDKIINLWNPKTGNKICRLEGHNDTVGTLLFSPHNNRLISGSDDRTICIWETKTRKNFSNLKGILDGSCQ
ncbi:MAG: hypothetical protein OMM_05577 [Candidatus Magnetoglobus multicellularis str. Araruama]|uniref:Uncharacterized protein n=1 Tax=Candidatus Magnetoglobus multicellularis str. Araruama TaxID=890399 RepID=A0A1V1NVG6_9BACT|nr:MAG: hypothetical protein OMM_05577 [Candidatus Magnetoglobus multicellularis str. Araruama]